MRSADERAASEIDRGMKIVRLKVCGITTFEDAEAALDAVPITWDSISISSPRYISPERVREIMIRFAWSDGRVQTVGVFVNESRPEQVINIMAASGVRLAQLHGDEDAAYCASIGGDRVIKALRVSDSFNPEAVLEYKVSAVLLDAYHPSLYGGTGQELDWSLAREAARLARIILAGGLGPQNIAEAIRTVTPFGVDVNSGVESTRPQGCGQAKTLEEGNGRVDHDLLSMPDEGGHFGQYGGSFGLRR
jgi:phosphoribosylanthranilate isomerase